nr:DNA recombination protein RmuC [Candidatus Saccharibacteria bacterium]
MSAVILLWLILALLIIIVGYLIFGSKTKQDNESVGLIKQDLTNLSQGLDMLKDSLNKGLSDNNQQMQRSLSSQLQTSSRLVADVTQRLTKLDETNKRVINVADELKTLQNVLSNPKQRGVLGEYYLQTVLENVLPTTNFKMQYKFKDGEIADAVVFLDKGKIIPIDSKFSLENYNRLIESNDKAEKERLAKQMKSDLKLRIDETSKYIKPDENTLDIAFMFIPSEAIYYDLIINEVGASQTVSRDLIQYAFRDKKVIIVSPTTLLAYLQTVMQGLRSLKIEEQAKD